MWQGKTKRRSVKQKMERYVTVVAMMSMMYERVDHYFEHPLQKAIEQY